MSKKNKVAKTILTLHLPSARDGGIPEDEQTATLLIQRGELGQARQFHYNGLFEDIVNAMREGIEALGAIEDNPPVVPDAPEEKKKKTTSKRKNKKVKDEEPTIDVPLEKGTKTVKMSAIKIVSGESDAAAYRLAVMLAGRLINGGLWDGESPIRFENVHEVAKKMKPLQDKELTLFELTDFVQSGETPDNTESATDTETDDETETVEEEDETQLTLMEMEPDVAEEAEETTEPDETAETAEPEADETQETPATPDEETPYLTMLTEKLSSDDTALLKQLADRIEETVEKVIHLTGFWENSPGQNQLKADLQNILLSPDFNHLPGIIDKRHEVIDTALTIAKAEEPEEETDYPESLDSPAKRAFYDVLEDAELAGMIYEEIQTGKKHSWKGDLIKERLVKGIIAAYVDGKEDLVEALFAIALKSDEFNTKASV